MKHYEFCVHLVDVQNDKVVGGLFPFCQVDELVSLDEACKPVELLNVGDLCIRLNQQSMIASC